MFKSLADHFGSILVTLLSFQSVCSALAIDNNQTLNKNEGKETKELVARLDDEYQIIHKWNTGGDVISPASGVGLVIVGTVSIIVTWFTNRPGPDKICGKTAIIDVNEDGIDYQYYVYSYTTSDTCDSSQRAKTITEKLSEALDDIHSQKANAVCLDFDHHGSWHGVLGLATKSSGISPQDACKDHHAGAKRDDAGFLELEGNSTEENSIPEIEERSTTKRSENGLVKRTPAYVTKTAEQTGDVKFSPSNKSQVLVAEIASKMYSQSYYQNCAGVEGTLTDANGVSVTYYYYGGGDENCDTTAEAKTIMRALDDAWDGLTGISAACLTMQHGSGTWRGYLGISTMPDDYRVTQLCG